VIKKHWVVQYRGIRSKHRYWSKGEAGRKITSCCLDWGIL
jgi:hypothetical protein